MATAIQPDRRARGRTPERKQFIGVSFELKAIDDTARTFEGYSATWDEDLGDDQILPGAFAKTIGSFKAGRKSIALIDTHNYNSILHAYGDLIDASEDERGLLSKWQVIPGPDGERVLDRLRGRAVRKMSIGYYPVEYKFVTRESDDRRIRQLSEINWEETSLVLFPMNPQADIDLNSVKSMSAEDQARVRQQLLDRRAEIDANLAELAADDTPAPEFPPERVDALKSRLLSLRIQRLATRQRGSERVPMTSMRTTP